MDLMAFAFLRVLRDLRGEKLDLGAFDQGLSAMRKHQI
jgi:hypothetical protein